MFLDASSSSEPFSMSTKAALSAVGIQKVFPTVELESRELGSRHDREVHHLVPSMLFDQLLAVLPRPLLLTSQLSIVWKMPCSPLSC